ncbi:hypothetical protein J4Q44_G00065220 [Coregonus suidteri]|uniref:Biotinidase n=1 Tax=Coregonus suidteri TaxID=861788 RepID=A0AAN8R562_9TELE
MSLRVLLAVAAVAVLCLFPVTLTRAGDRTDGSRGQSYVAAVYEHRVILNPAPHVPLSPAAALKHMMSNLDVYEEQAARAAEQGAQIIVFPEDGLQGFNFSRLSISAYLETIPDPHAMEGPSPGGWLSPESMCGSGHDCPLFGPRSQCSGASSPDTDCDQERGDRAEGEEQKLEPGLSKLTLTKTHPLHHGNDDPKGDPKTISSPAPQPIAPPPSSS